MTLLYRLYNQEKVQVFTLNRDILSAVVLVNAAVQLSSLLLKKRSTTSSAVKEVWLFYCDYCGTNYRLIRTTLTLCTQKQQIKATIRFINLQRTKTRNLPHKGQSAQLAFFRSNSANSVTSRNKITA